MALACPSCGEMIQPADVNVAADVAKCAGCGEVFRPSRVLNETGRAGSPGMALPPRPNALPSDSRVRIEDLGGVLTIDLPPTGFHWALIFGIFFALAWWSFLAFFIGFAFMGWRQAESIPQELAWGLPCMVLFMMPFFIAGLAMIYGILAPLFGRTQIQVDGLECTYRSTLFGWGRTRRATIEDTSLRWIEEGAMNRPRSAGLQQATAGLHPAHILLCLGRLERPIGGGLSRIEQEYLFHELTARLPRAGSR